jgi:hypothetical protein|tara:strand:+ start:2017 stop:2244 length:228 start_codon:yes stop_codon:yes gene_type:complete
MAEFLLTIVILGLIIAGMAIGAILNNKPITGSCGGVGAALGEANYNCDICGGDPNKCDEQDDDSLAYDASSEEKQ